MVRRGSGARLRTSGSRPSFMLCRIVSAMESPVFRAARRTSPNNSFGIAKGKVLLCMYESYNRECFGQVASSCVSRASHGVFFRGPPQGYHSGSFRFISAGLPVPFLPRDNPAPLEAPVGIQLLPFHSRPGPRTHILTGNEPGQYGSAEHTVRSGFPPLFPHSRPPRSFPGMPFPLPHFRRACVCSTLLKASLLAK